MRTSICKEGIRLKRLVLLSGGIDSSTCLAMAREELQADEVVALNCYYGQKNKKEMQSAKKIAEHYGVKLIEFDLSEIFRSSDCPMLSHSKREIDHRTYKEQTSETGEERPISSYVPFRNGLMLSAATAVAYSIGASEVWYGAHADDAAGNAYPDCSEAFVAAMNEAALLGTAGAVRIEAPLKSLHKVEIVRKGLDIGVPYELTWSCYESGEHPCGKCGTCIEIRKAFKANGGEYPVK